ncbi:MAG: hypothetical protein AB2A00_33365, partial [Myxococcota bacterium]
MRATAAQVLVGLLLGGGVAWAQEASGGLRVRPGVERMGAAELLAAHDEALARTHAALSTTLTATGEARRARDAVQLRCASVQVAEVRKLLRQAEAAGEHLETARARGDLEAARVELSRMQLAADQAQRHQAEARRCRSMPTTPSGVTEVSVVAPGASPTPAIFPAQPLAGPVTTVE